jgi:hypothetical protein
LHSRRPDAARLSKRRSVYCRQFPVAACSADAIQRFADGTKTSIVDDLPWWWADASGIADLPLGPHKVTIQLVDANHNIPGHVTTLKFTIPKSAAGLTIELGAAFLASTRLGPNDFDVRSQTKTGMVP